MPEVLDHLSDIEKAQLLHCRPELRIFDCIREDCGGQVRLDHGEWKCSLCNREYDEKGELI